MREPLVCHRIREQQAGTHRSTHDAFSKNIRCQPDASELIADVRPRRHLARVHAANRFAVFQGGNGIPILAKLENGKFI